MTRNGSRGSIHEHGHSAPDDQHTVDRGWTSTVDRLDFPDMEVRRLLTRHKNILKAARRKERSRGGLLCRWGAHGLALVFHCLFLILRSGKRAREHLPSPNCQHAVLGVSPRRASCPLEACNGRLRFITRIESNPDLLKILVDNAITY